MQAVHQHHVKLIGADRMLTEMENEGPELDSEQLEKLERRLPKSLPDSYVQFLNTYNGGEPVERAIDFHSSKLKQQGDYIATFYEVSDDVSYGLLPNIEIQGSTFPAGLICIATSPSGNYYLLSLREGSYGKVFYKDHAIEDNSIFDDAVGVYPESIELISDSFNDFICRLYDPDI